MHNVEKWPDLLLKSCGVNTARFLKYIWPFFNIMHGKITTEKNKDEFFQLFI